MTTCLQLLAKTSTFPESESIRIGSDSRRIAGLTVAFEHRGPVLADASPPPPKWRCWGPSRRLCARDGRSLAARLAVEHRLVQRCPCVRVAARQEQIATSAPLLIASIPAARQAITLVEPPPD